MSGDDGVTWGDVGEEQSTAPADVAASTPDEPGVERAAPVGSGRRIASIDVLRGFALLGILVMNIPFFALSSAGFFHPPAVGGFEGLNYATWLGSHLLFELKMMSIFSMLFGAGIVLFSEKAEARTGRSAGLHYRRMWWLLVLGLIHAYVIWEGDILVTYAMFGMLVYPLRRLAARWLVVIALALAVMAPAISTAQGFMFEHMRTQADRYEALVAAGEEVPPEVEGWARRWIGEIDPETGEVIEEGLGTGFYPGPAEMAAERRAVLGSWWDRMAHRAKDVVFFQTYINATWGVWRVTAMMLAGMALFKWGVFSAARSARFYWVMAVVGFGVGWPIVGAGAVAMERVDFDVVEMFKYTWHFNYVGSVLVALGWVAVVMLVCKAGVLGALRAGLAAVGRMAFTNYIMQSLICGAIFFGWGFGQYGRFSRSELIPIVLAIWVFQIVFSVVWLRGFRFGPLEWAWRSLTYWRVQPLKRGKALGAGQ